MRKAAGIILIILGMWGLIGLISGIIVLSDSGFNPYVPFFLWRIVCIPFFVIGGILCLRKKYWRVCLASALLAVFLSVFFLVLFPWGLLFSNFISMGGWIIWVMLVAAVIAVIFILRRKKEWQEISDSVDGKVSYGG